MPGMALIQQEIPTDTEPFKGQQFSSKQEMENTINSYLSANGYVCKYENGFIPDKKYPDYLIYRWRCERAGKPSKKGTGQRKCVSLKCDCKFKISCVNPKDNSTNIRDCTKFQITGICLEHTGGCLGKDHDMNQAILKRQGRKYDTSVLDLIKSDVISGRYSTSDVQSKLIEVGCREVSLAEATNLRYRLKRGLPIKGWDPKNDSPNYVSDEEAAEMRTMENYLFNDDLAQELKAGGRDSVRKLDILHKGLKSTDEGYDYKMISNDEGRFTGTAWMTGRMRARLHKNGNVLLPNMMVLCRPLLTTIPLLIN